MYGGQASPPLAGIRSHHHRLFIYEMENHQERHTDYLSIRQLVRSVQNTHTHTHTQCYSFLLRNPTTELVVSAAYTLIKPDLSRVKYISFSWENGPFGGLRSTQ